jgi:hypothetical protein
MTITARVEFEITNTFAEWEQSFYSMMNEARAAGIYEVYHGYEADNPKKCMVVALVESPKIMDDFFKSQATRVNDSGHILESAKITIYNS